MEESNTNMKYRVVIPCAGKGIRVSESSHGMNKALIQISAKPAISHIIEKFPEDIEIVIALGYQGNILKQFLEIAYPTRTFHFVEVSKYEGDDSGLTLSLWECKDYLQCPFIFCSNDTVLSEDTKIPAPDCNWAGYDFREDCREYRTFGVFDGYVGNIFDKCEDKSNNNAYIGICGVLNYQFFWKQMQDAINEKNYNIGETYALTYLMFRQLKAIKMDWLDFGNEKSLESAKRSLLNGDSPNLLPKTDEAIWFVGDFVIKYHKDISFILRRYMRSDILEGFVPYVCSVSENFYKYEKVPGEIFSKNANVPNLKKLLDWLESDFWRQEKLNVDDSEHFAKTTKAFYRDKTYTRIQEYFDRFNLVDVPGKINNEMVPEISDMLGCINWDLLSNGYPYRIHGDLHFENILVKPDGSYCLLDWRQDFGGWLGGGDLYYDLAKLRHGMIVGHSLVFEEKYYVNQTDRRNIHLSIKSTRNLQDCLEYFDERYSRDINKIKMLTALIFLNIAALHHEPYSHFLFNLGKLYLWRCLKSEKPNNA